MKFPLSLLNETFNTIEEKEGVFSIWGEFGVGKTTLALQIARENALNRKNVLYIYSKPNLPFSRIFALYKSNLDELLDKIQFIKSSTYIELAELVFNLEFLILNRLRSGNGLVGTIIIDSLTDLYRLELQSDKRGKNVILNYKLNQLLGNLTFLNKQYDLSILIINELSKATIKGDTYDVESGGNVMDYWVKHSIKIERTEVANNRKFILYDEDGKPLSVLNSRLTDHGFE